MNTLDKKGYDTAVDAWKKCLADYPRMKALIPPNYVFTLSPEQIKWAKTVTDGKVKNFRVDMGILDQKQVIIILVRIDEKGQNIVVDGFPYSLLGEMEQDLPLYEKQSYTLVKTALLSKDLRSVDDNSHTTFPIADHPIMKQDKAIEAIEQWRNEGQNWLYVECNAPYNGTRIFNSFYVPILDLTLPEGLNWITCTFALRYSSIYQRMLVSLVFISFYKNLGNDVSSPAYISNTYDWSQPCPPICQI